MAVIAVLLYHGGVSGMRGGFLGVDIFFVLSGYLITTLLFVEFGRSGRIGLLAFWARRARRLLPALGVVFAGILLYALVVAAPAELAKIRGDALASLGYVANWRFVFSGQSYFDQFAAPSPFRHLWSLAIEEQFYLVWPIVVLLLLRWRPRLGMLARVFAFGAVLSAVLMAALYSPGSDPSRVYYGTDTRSQALLVGATLAVVLLRLRTQGERRVRSVPWVRSGIGGAVVLGVLLVTVRDTSPWMYRGGYFLAAIATAAVIGAAVQPRRNLVRAGLSPTPLRWIGKISYGLYLWHWPVFLTITTERTGTSGVALLGLRLAVTTAIATASYVWVELPIRHRTWTHGARRAVLVVAMAAGVLAAVFVALPEVRGPSRNEVAVADNVPSTTAPGATAPPGKVLVVGDSVAKTLGDGFDRESHAAGVELFNRGELACGLAQKGRIERGGRWVDTEATCDDWPAQWQAYVDEIDPDVSTAIFDVFVVSDLEVDGKSLPFGSKASDRYLLRQLDRGVDILRSRGGSVVLATAPSNERPEVVGQAVRWAEDDPARIDHWNALLRRYVKDRSDPNVTVADLNEYVSPKGRFTNARDGVMLRYDGVHFNPKAGQLVFRWLLPQLPSTRGS
ncbi:MAG: acyltransferase [Acidimicrobiia bacterium]|nr:acyltransferase [Acidimicrobiia bacterium]